MSRILIIEDNAAVVETIRDAAKDAMPDIFIKHAQFAEMKQQLEESRPDIVVLDVYEGVATGDKVGEPAWQAIWDRVFCPVIIYSAGAMELEPPVPHDHPFVKAVKKGRKSEEIVVKHLCDFQPFVAVFRQVREEIAAVLRNVLQVTSAHMLKDNGDRDEQCATLARAARRRVAAMIDEKTVLSGEKLVGWEQYLVPALGEHPLTADVLRRVGGDAADATSYRLVLTPTCDMVRGKPKIEAVLTATCAPAQDFVTNCIGRDAAERKIKERLPGALTRGAIDGYLPLPEFPGEFPCMTACLKKLDLIPLSDIGTPGAEAIVYERVASIDSPFREQVAWHFVHTSGRPGIPDRDMDEWTDRIIGAARK